MGQENPDPTENHERAHHDRSPPHHRSAGTSPACPHLTPGGLRPHPAHRDSHFDRGRRARVEGNGRTSYGDEIPGDGQGEAIAFFCRNALVRLAGWEQDCAAQGSTGGWATTPRASAVSSSWAGPRRATTPSPRQFPLCAGSSPRTGRSWTPWSTPRRSGAPGPGEDRRYLGLLNLVAVLIAATSSPSVKSTRGVNHPHLLLHMGQCT